MSKQTPPIIELKNLRKSFGSEVILDNFNFTLNHNELVTILGPSGSGKSTVIKLIAGFETLDSGIIRLNGAEVNDLPSNQREVNTVFQNYSLFPHMTVYQNIAFGLRMKKKSADYIKQAVADVLKVVKMEKFSDRRPDQLSGGQQQRVAVARAIVNKPLILLLDEPFSALDEKLRKQMQVELKQMQRTLGITFIFVTHDQEEALSMSDTIIVINNGKIEQIGPPREIYESPVNNFVAGFVGELNSLSAVVTSCTANQMTVTVEDVYSSVVSFKENFNVGDRMQVLLRPENVRFIKSKEEGSGQLRGRITEIRYKGALLDYVAMLPNDKRVVSSVFRNHGASVDDHQIGDSVAIQWLTGKEIITK